MSSAVRIIEGATVPLALLLEDGDTAKFPQAVVRTNAGVAVVGSPFDLTHQGEGLYSSTSLTMTSDAFLTVAYIVYNEVGHTTESTIHLRGSDVFVIDTTALVAQDIRDAMKLAPTAGAPAAGSVDEHLDDVLADTAAMQPIIAANLDVVVSSRSSHTAADVDTTLGGSHGVGSWATATGFAVAGDAMALTDAAIDLIWDELQTGHSTPGSFGLFLDTAISGVTGIVDWTSGEREQIRDALGVGGVKTTASGGQLQSMQGATFNSATDSLEALRNRGDAAWVTAVGFAVAGDAMTLTAAAVDLVWDELQAGHTVAGSFGLFLDATISGVAGIAPQAVRDAMKLAPTAGVPAAGSVDLVLDDILSDTATMQPTIATNLDVQLSAKGAGAWDSVATGFSTPADVTAVITQGNIAWTTATGFAVAGDAMALTPAAIDLIWDELQAGHSTAGSFGLFLDAAVSTAGSPAAIATAVWAHDLTTTHDGLTDRSQAGGALLWARILDTNRQELDTVADRLNIYDDAGTAVVSFAPLADHVGGTIVGAAGSPARRTGAFS